MINEVCSIAFQLLREKCKESTGHGMMTPRGMFFLSAVANEWPSHSDDDLSALWSLEKVKESAGSNADESDLASYLESLADRNNNDNQEMVSDHLVLMEMLSPYINQAVSSLVPVDHYFWPSPLLKD